MISLTVKQLQEITKQTVLNNKLVVSLREEVRKAFGPSIVCERVSIEDISRQVNDLLETLDNTGRHSNKTLQTTLLLNLANQNTPEARKLAARLLPERLAMKLAYDKNVGVRVQVAKRAPIGILVEMCRKFPHDDNLSLIKTERLLAEFDAKNIQKLKTQDSELSDGWYHQQARKLIDDYGELSYGVPRRVDRSWKVPAAKRLCASYKSSYNIDIDCEKLLQNIDELLEELDTDRVPLSMREIKESLTKRAKQDIISETRVMPMLSEEASPLEALLKTQSQKQFLTQFESLFEVKKSNLIGQIKSLMLQEGIVDSVVVPVRAKLPNFIDESIERAFNMYVSHWNNMNENVVFDLNWNVDPHNDDVILFGAVIK